MSVRLIDLLELKYKNGSTPNIPKNQLFHITHTHIYVCIYLIV